MTEPHVAVLSQVQQFLDRQHGLYIDGRPGPAQSEKRLAIFDPATGQEIASTADANEADVDNAVMSAWRAFVSRRWAGRSGGNCAMELSVDDWYVEGDASTGSRLFNRD